MILVVEMDQCQRVFPSGLVRLADKNDFQHRMTVGLPSPFHQRVEAGKLVLIELGKLDLHDFLFPRRVLGESRRPALSGLISTGKLGRESHPPHHGFDPHNFSEIFEISYLKNRIRVG